jgi:hypothetical protein
MTNAEDGRPVPDDADRSRFSSADVLAGLGASLAWATATYVGLGDGRSAAAALVALGFASSSTVPLVLFVRMAGWRSALTSVEAAALVVLVPVALFASVIQTHTHHRALGAVTFAGGATFMFGVAFLLSRRIFREAETGGGLWRLLRGALRGASGVSLAWILWTLIRSSSRDGPHATLVDGTLGLLTIALFSRTPRLPLPSALARAAPALFVTFLGAGVVTAWKNAPSFAILCERAPVTVGISGVFLCR